MSTLPQGTRTIAVGKVPDILKIEIIPDLVDWTQTKLTRVQVHYAEPGNGIYKTYEQIVRKGGKQSEIVQIVKDKTINSFAWQATLNMSDCPEWPTTLDTTT